MYLNICGHFYFILFYSRFGVMKMYFSYKHIRFFFLTLRIITLKYINLNHHAFYISIFYSVSGVVNGRLL